MYFILFEDCSHGLVTSDQAFIVRILEIALSDVGPDSLHCLRAGKLAQHGQLLPRFEPASDGGEKDWRMSTHLHFAVQQGRKRR